LVASLAAFMQQLLWLLLNASLIISNKVSNT